MCIHRVKTNIRQSYSKNNSEKSGYADWPHVKNLVPIGTGNKKLFNLDGLSFKASEQEIIGSSLFYTHFCIFFLLSNTYNDTSLSLYIANAPLFIPPQ